MTIELFPEYLTQTECCKLLRCGRTKLTELRDRADFPKPTRLPRPDGRLGRRLLFARGELIAWREKQRLAQRAEPAPAATAETILRGLGRPFVSLSA